MGRGGGRIFCLQIYYFSSHLSLSYFFPCPQMRNYTESKSKKDLVVQVLGRMADMIVCKTGHEIITMIIPFLHPHIHLAFAVGGLCEIFGQELLLSIEFVGCTLSPSPPQKTSAGAAERRLQAQRLEISRERAYHID